MGVTTLTCIAPIAFPLVVLRAMSDLISALLVLWLIAGLARSNSSDHVNERHGGLLILLHESVSPFNYHCVFEGADTQPSLCVPA